MMELNTTEDYCKAWIGGHHGEVMDNIQDFYYYERLRQGDKTMWLIQLCESIKPMLEKRSGFGDYNNFLRDLETAITRGRLS